MAIDPMYLKIGEGLGAILVVSAAFSVVITGPVSGFFGRRGVAKGLAGYVGVAPRQINIDNAGWVHRQVFPYNGVVYVPVSISDENPLKKELTAYYRHPAGVGSEMALHDFFADPKVVNYLTQPESRLERMLHAF